MAATTKKGRHKVQDSVVKAKPKKPIKLSKEDKDALYAIGPAPRLLLKDRLRDPKKKTSSHPEYRNLLETRRSGNPLKNWAIPTASRMDPEIHLDMRVKMSLWPQLEKYEMYKKTGYIGSSYDIVPRVLGDPNQREVVKKVKAIELDMIQQNNNRLWLKRRTIPEHQALLYNTPKLLEKEARSVKRKRIMKYHKEKKKWKRLFKDQRKRWLQGPMHVITAKKRSVRESQTDRSLINPGDRHRIGVNTEYRWRIIRRINDIPKNSIRLSFRKTSEDRELWKKEQMINWHRKKSYTRLRWKKIVEGALEPAMNLLKVEDLVEIRKEFIKRAPKVRLKIRKPKKWRKTVKKKKKIKKRFARRSRIKGRYFPVMYDYRRVWDIVKVWTEAKHLHIRGEISLEDESIMLEQLEPHTSESQYRMVNTYSKILKGTKAKVKNESLDEKSNFEGVAKYYAQKRAENWKKTKLTFPKPPVKAVTNKTRLPGEVRPETQFENRLKERYTAKIARHKK